MTVNPIEMAASGNGHAPKNKVRPLAELEEIIAGAKKSGRTVVLCHGVFDLVHLGHIKHLETARREGDVLVVSVTADNHVNKGPGRPIFPDHMRAEMLSAIEFVDYVTVNSEPTAENVPRRIKPDVYVKGSDYENPDEDITGGINREREAVENHGGRLVFTKDITFSSSALINRYLDVYDPPLRDFLENFRERVELDELIGLLDSIQDMKVLMIGDTIIDEYVYVEPLGTPAKENIIATQSKGAELFAGGVLATANHIADFCRQVDVVTVLGSDESHEDLVKESAISNVNLSLMKRPDVPTTRKTRFVDTSYMRKLFEVYAFDDKPFTQDLNDRLCALVAKNAPDYDLVIVNDFGHGLVTSGMIDTVLSNARFLAVNAQTNAGNQGFNLITKYPRADYVCISGPEARLAVFDKYSDLATVTGEALPKKSIAPAWSSQAEFTGVTLTTNRKTCAGYRHSPRPSLILSELVTRFLA